MKVKKYVAPTMPEVMIQIRKELGSNAVILNSKEVHHGGFLGFFKKKKIEVVAALDPQPHIPKKTPSNEPIMKEVEDRKNDTNDDVLHEIKHLKKIIEQQSIQTSSNYKPDYKVVYQHLLDQEVTKDLATQIMDDIVKKHERNSVKPTLELIYQDTEIEITRRLNEVTFEGVTYKNKIIQFVGPTGVGKTTTIAKVAATSMLKDHKKVALITADTYRIAAIEQLKTYARILGVPVEVAYTIEDYKTAIKKFTDYDLILVDTAGRNFREKKYVEELRRTIRSEGEIETYLVLSLTAKPNDINDIYNQFQHIPIKQLIFTKVDETRQYGSMLNVVVTSKKGIAYITNGQDVPDDVIQPTPDVISNYIVGGNCDA